MCVCVSFVVGGKGVCMYFVKWALEFKGFWGWNLEVPIWIRGSEPNSRRQPSLSPKSQVLKTRVLRQDSRCFQQVCMSSYNPHSPKGS